MTATVGNGWASTHASATAVAVARPSPSCSARARRSRLPSLSYTRADSPLPRRSSRRPVPTRRAAACPCGRASRANRRRSPTGSRATAARSALPARGAGCCSRRRRCRERRRTRSPRRSVQRPVGDAERAEVTRAPVRVERVDQRADVGRRVVAVEQVDVDRAAEPPDAVAQVARDVRRRDPDAVAVRMRALGHDHEPLAHAGPVAQPLPSSPSAPPPSYTCAVSMTVPPASTQASSTAKSRSRVTGENPASPAPAATAAAPAARPEELHVYLA